MLLVATTGLLGPAGDLLHTKSIDKVLNAGLIGGLAVAVAVWFSAER